MQASWENAFFARRYQQTLTDLLANLQADPELLAIFSQAYPEMWDDLCEKGYRCLDLSQIPQAETIFAFLHNNGGESDPAVLSAFADCLSSQRKFPEAAEKYEQTIDLAPTIPDAWIALAEHWMILQQPEYAIQRFEGALALLDSPEHPYQAHIEKCLAFAQEAVRDLDKP